MPKTDPEQSYRDYSRALLHWPQRFDSLDTKREHTIKAARLSRALWLLVSTPAVDWKDEIDQYAIVELADEIADHATAAYYLEEVGEDKGKGD